MNKQDILFIIALLNYVREEALVGNAEFDPDDIGILMAKLGDPGMKEIYE